MSKDKRPSPSLLRSSYMKYVDDHKYLPEYMKPELKSMVARHFNLLAETIGVVELTYRRTMAVKEKTDETQDM